MKITALLDNRKFVSKIISKDLANEKKDEKIIKNKNINSSQSSSSYEFTIGLLGPEESVILTTEFIQVISSYDTSYQYLLPQKYPCFIYKNKNKTNTIVSYKNIKGEFYIDTSSSISRLVLINTNSEFTYEKEITNNVQAMIKIHSRESKSKIKDGLNMKTAILFSTENMMTPTLYAQYNPDMKETTYVLNYMNLSETFNYNLKATTLDFDNSVPYYSKYPSSEINDSPGLFIFLFDQSNSMKGRPMKMVKESIKLFLQSLPTGSYFQLIGFGSSFIKYHEKPLEYTFKNVFDLQSTIRDLGATLGETDIYSPLFYIYNEKDYKNISLKKTIFLLTDGEVENKEQCLELIGNNSECFRVHAIGIGNKFDKDLIEQCGRLGKGSATFVENISDLGNEVVEALDKSLRPYIVNAEIVISNNELQHPKYQYPNNPLSICQDDLVNYRFICDGQIQTNTIKMVLKGILINGEKKRKNF